MRSNVRRHAINELCGGSVLSVKSYALATAPTFTHWLLSSCGAAPCYVQSRNCPTFVRNAHCSSTKAPNSKGSTYEAGRDGPGRLLCICKSPGCRRSRLPYLLHALLSACLPGTCSIDLFTGIVPASSVHWDARSLYIFVHCVKSDVHDIVF
jgi:hypothetical protein